MPSLSAVWLLAILALGLAGFGLLAWAAPLLRRLGARNAARQPLRAALIVLGLTLSTTVLGSALIAGDTITYTLRSLVAGTLGTVDEIVVANPPRGRLYDRLRAVAEPGLGGLATAGLSSFDEVAYDRLAAQVAADADVAGMAPALVGQAGVVHTRSRRLIAAMPTLAVPRAIAPAFGVPAGWSSLAQDEIVANLPAAQALGAAAGDELELRWNDLTWKSRIRSVAPTGGLGGAGPLLLVPLDRYQQITGQRDQINVLLVTNHGGVASVARSAVVTRRLRWALADRRAAQALHDLLGGPQLQRALREAAGLVRPSERPRIAALRAAAALPDLRPEFVDLVTDPRLRARLLALTVRLEDGGSAASNLRMIAPLSVVAVKAEALAQAESYGAVVANIFLVLGIFAVAAATLLIALIFALLAADRGAELATMRALGMRRPQIMGLFLWEGLIYNLLGAGLGALTSVAAGYGLVRSLGSAIAPLGLRLAPHVEARSLLIAFAGGALLNGAAMLVAAWRVSHTQIVAATRGEALDERPARSQRALGLLLLAAAAGVWWRWGTATELDPRPPLVAPGAGSLVLVAVALSLLPLVRARAGRRDGAPRLLGMLLGLALWLIWYRPVMAARLQWDDTRTGVITIALGSVVLLLATIMVAVQALHPLLAAVDHALIPLARARAVLRPAAAALRRQGTRTALTAAMFGLVLCIMVAALTLVSAVIRAYAGDEPAIAGFDLRADVDASRLGPLDAALRTAPAVSPASFAAIGSVARQDAQAIRLGALRAAWQTASLSIVDVDFIAAIHARVDRRANGYSTSDEAWRALGAQPGTAILVGRLGDEPDDARDAREPAVVWVRPVRGGTPVRLTVIGVIDGRSELDAGLYLSEATAAALENRTPAPSTYYLAPAPGVRIADAAEGLRVSFGDKGITVSTIGETERIVRAVQLLLTRIVQGFMGLGLVAGVAALGLLGVQSVLERRQQLGTLRALGFTRRQMRATLAVEGAVVAALGLGLGLALGLLLARSIVALLAAVYPEVRYAVPWAEVAITLGVALGGSSLAVAIAAHQAGRVAPAEALRVV